MHVPQELTLGDTHTHRRQRSGEQQTARLRRREERQAWVQNATALLVHALETAANGRLAANVSHSHNGDDVTDACARRTLMISL